MCEIKTQCGVIKITYDERYFPKGIVCNASFVDAVIKRETLVCISKVERGGDGGWGGRLR